MREERLYNVLFPLWFFFVIPSPILLLILAGNWLVDSLVLHFGCRKLQIAEAKEVRRRSILKVCLIGFLSDSAGAASLLGMTILVGWLQIDYDVGRGIYCVLFSLPGVLLAGILIYSLNRRFSFRDTSLEPEQIRRLGLWLALYTAPYLMVLPQYW